LILCIAIATAFALPAAVAGYDVVFALSQICRPSPACREVFARRGVHRWHGLRAWLFLPEPARLSRLARVENPFRPIRTAATREGCALAPLVEQDRIEWHVEDG
jgi:hypothetical protein